MDEKNLHAPSLQSSEHVSSPHHLCPGTMLQNRYVVERVLGEGGFGITYLCRDRLLRILVAVKEYFPVSRCTRNAPADPDVTVLKGYPERLYWHGMKKYLAEAQILASLEKQPVIVGVHDYFEENNTAYIVMEYIHGATLAGIVGGAAQGERGTSVLSGRLKTRNSRPCFPSSPDELFILLVPLFDALGAVHEAGILHRDICPENLILEEGGIRLIDFGCAREAASLAETQTITLRHGYAPIEQYQQSGGQGPWTDIYALCATIYYCLTGIRPPLSTDRISWDRLVSPRKLGVQITANQDRALMKGLRVRPHQRFRSVSELKKALCQVPRPITRHCVSDRSRKMKRK